MSPRSTLPSAMTTLVALTDPPNRLSKIAVEKNTLLQRNEFSRVGTSTSKDSSSQNQSGAFAVTPHVIHFGGFTVGRRHTQTFKVTNVGDRSNRVVVIAPTTDSFKVKCGKNESANPKPGKLAPGSSQFVTVEFTPTDGSRYYYDCVRLHLQNAPGIVVPIHAYPVANEVLFPKTIDFGLRVVGRSHQITKSIKCNVPIDFEFALGLGDKSGLFSVTPATGIVPANGSVPVTITFAPQKSATANCEVSVSISQFGAEAVVCAVRGTGFPSGRNIKKTKEAGNDNPQNPLSLASEYQHMYGSSKYSGGALQRPAPPPDRLKKENSSPQTASAIVAAFELRATGVDKDLAETMVRTHGLTKVHKKPPAGSAPQTRGPRGRRLQSARGTSGSSPESNGNQSDSSEDEQLIDGVFVPKVLRKGADFIKVLNQKKGKLRVKDIEKALGDRHAKVAAAKSLRNSAATAAGAIAKMKASAAAATFRGLLEKTLQARRRDDGGDGIEDTSVDGTTDVNTEAPQTGAAMDALKTVFDAAAFRSRSENEAMAVLDDPGLNDEVKALIFQREFDRVKRFEKQKEWTDCVAVGECVLSKKEYEAALRRRDQNEAALRYVQASAAMARLANGQATANGARYYVEDGANDLGRIGDTETTSDSTSSTPAPSFNPLSADDWPKRREALGRFTQAVRWVVIRNRGEKRLICVRNLLRAARDGSGASASAARDLMGSGADSSSRVSAGYDLGVTKTVTSDFDLARQVTRQKEDAEAIGGAARLGRLEFLGRGTETGTEKGSRLGRRPVLFPKVLGKNFTQRNAIPGEDIQPISAFEQVDLMTPKPRLTWKLRGYESFAEARPSKLEGDGSPPSRAETPAIRNGAEEEEQSGVCLVPRVRAGAHDKEGEHTAKGNSSYEQTVRNAFELKLESALSFASAIAPDLSIFGIATDPVSNKTRFHPERSNTATPSFVTSSSPGIDDIDSKVLPGTFGLFPDCLLAEPVGVNCLQTFSNENEPFVAKRWVSKRTTRGGGGASFGRRRDEWFTQDGNHHGKGKASWLTGPDPLDLMDDGDDGGGAFAAPAPTLVSVRAEIFALLFGNNEDNDNDTSADASATAVGTSKDDDAVKKTTQAQVVVPGGDEARNSFTREMDFAIETARRTRVALVATRANEWDASLTDPGLRWRVWEGPDPEVYQGR